MWPVVVKILVTAVIVAAVSEIARRSTFWAALLVSLPLTSLLALAWLYVDTGDTGRVAAMAEGIVWLVLPSLVLFLMLPPLLRAGYPFWASLAASCAGTALAYLLLVRLLTAFGGKI